MKKQTELDYELIKKCKVSGTVFAEWIGMNGFKPRTSAKDWHDGKEVFWTRGDGAGLTTSQLWSLFMDQVEKQAEDEE
jgi:hypothetical protein